MANIQTAIDWAIATCNMSNPYALYTMNTNPNNGPTRYGGVDGQGNVYYDCSSFISAALTYAGFFSSNPWFTTSSMGNYLLQAGFQEVNRNGELKPGDICVNPGSHTEMVYQGGIGKARTMGAHTDGIAAANQVSINSGYTSGSSWAHIYRFGGGGTTPDDPPYVPVDPDPDIPTTPGDGGDYTHQISTILLLKLCKIVV